MRYRKAKTRDFANQVISGEIEVTDDCLMWPYGKTTGGYALGSWGDRHINVCRYLLSAIKGEPPTSKHQCAHSCGKGKQGCVNPKHLRWATAKENAQDTILHGKSKGASKLSYLDAMNIIKSPENREVLAERYGLSKERISEIQRRRGWRRIDLEVMFAITMPPRHAVQASEGNCVLKISRAINGRLAIHAGEFRNYPEHNKPDGLPRRQIVALGNIRQIEEPPAGIPVVETVDGKVWHEFTAVRAVVVSKLLSGTRGVWVVPNDLTGVVNARYEAAGVNGEICNT